MNFLLNSRHSYMTLVDADPSVCPTWFWMLPFVSALLDVDSVESVILILTCKVYPGGNSIHIATVLQLHFYL
jgi:hypothetical protein